MVLGAFVAEAGSRLVATESRQIPVWDAAVAAREADKDPGLCAWPGCRRPKATLEPGKRGRPPRYCLEADGDAEEPHTGYWASKARAQAAGKAEPDAEPVSGARLTAGSILDGLERYAREMPGHFDDLLTALETLRDADALDLELDQARARFEREAAALREQLAAAEGVAEAARRSAQAADLRAENNQRFAETWSEQHAEMVERVEQMAADLAIAQEAARKASEAAEAARAAQAAAETERDDARSEREAALAAQMQAERQRAAAQTERDQALDARTEAEAERNAAVARAEQATEAAADAIAARQAADAARQVAEAAQREAAASLAAAQQRISDLKAQVADAVAERDAARTDRSELRTERDGLKAELAEARQALRDAQE